MEVLTVWEKQMSKKRNETKVQYLHLVFLLSYNFFRSIFLSYFYFLLYSSAASSAVIPRIISKPGVFVLFFAGVLVAFCSGVCTTFSSLFPLIWSRPVVLFSGCVTFAVALASVEPLLTTLALPLLPPLLWLLPPLLPLELVSSQQINVV